MKSKMIVFGLALLLLNSGFSFAEEGAEAKSPETTVKEETTDAPKFCLICGPEEKTEALSISYKYKGKKYSFCSMDCLKAFKKDPSKFLNGKSDHHKRYDEPKQSH